MSRLVERHTWVRRWIQSSGLKYKTFAIRPESVAENGFCVIPDDKPREHAVIFCHGLGNDLFFPNLGLLEHLTRQNFLTLSIDLAGHGQTCTSTFALDELTPQMPAAMATLLREYPGIRKFHLVGYSFGAALATHCAANNADLVQSLTTIAMPDHLSPGPGYLTEIATPLSRAWLAAARQYGFSGIQPALGSFRRSVYPIRCPSDIPYLIVANEYLKRLNPKEALASLSIPVLGIFGRFDHIAPAAHFAEILGSPGRRVTILSTANHFLTLLEPETWKLTADFLRSIE